MSTPAILHNGNNIVVVYNNNHYSATSAHKNFGKILEAIKNKAWETLPELFNIKTAIEKYASGFVKIVDDEFYYKDEVIHTTLTKKIMAMYEDGFSIDPMVRFLENLMENPSRTAVNELYLFLESGQMPITDDGHFLAYKKVRDDYRDVHSGKFDNSIGQILSMDRRDVDDNRNNTCSYGFHFCSLAYLSNFGGSRIMILKINPRDVVSIPADYNNTKGRTCRYEVVGEYNGSMNKNAFTKPVYSEDVYTDHSYDWEAESKYVKEEYANESFDQARYDMLNNRKENLEKVLHDLDNELSSLEDEIGSLEDHISEYGDNDNFYNTELNRLKEKQDKLDIEYNAKSDELNEVIAEIENME